MQVRQFDWVNEPPQWSGDASRLAIVTGKETDFWQHTFYGFRRDDGHAWLTGVDGDFTASATVTGDYQNLYDQAGLMLRLDAQNWIKTGVEFTDGMMHFSVVVTRDGASDWSVIPLPAASTADPVELRLTRHGDAARVQYRSGDGWQMARLAPFPAAAARVGVMACSPQRAGFEAVFQNVRVGDPIARQLHSD